MTYELSVVPDGWSDQRWAERLDQMARICIVPLRAEELRAAARAVRQRVTDRARGRAQRPGSPPGDAARRKDARDGPKAPAAERLF